MTVRQFAMRYDAWVTPLLFITGTGPGTASIELDDASLRVRMSFWFEAAIPRAAIAGVTHDANLWGSIGVHTNFLGQWAVNGSARGIVKLDLDPPAEDGSPGCSPSPSSASG